MVVPLVLLLVSLAGTAVGVIWPGLGVLLLICGSASLASLLLLLGEGFRRRRVDETDRSARPPSWHSATVQRAGPRWVVVDGSNVMYWRDGIPQVETVRDVLAALAARGFTASVVFDANAGHLLAGKYLHHGALGRLVGLPEDRVMVVNKGQIADRIVLQAARDFGARIVTNDRYREWEADFPEVAEPGHLIRGGYREGGLWLALEPARLRSATATP